MTDRDLLLAAVLDNPADDTARLVLADKLDELGGAKNAHASVYESVLSGQVKLVSAHFDAKVKKGAGCWLWTGRLAPNGYGHYWRHRKMSTAHRIAYQFVCGAVSGDTYICHRCDNRACVRPDHLFAGTPADNAQDMVRKGRHRYIMPSSRGEKNSQAVLTETQVRTIRRLVKEGRKQADIAKQFGVTFQTVSDIARRRRWKHLAD